MKLLSNTYYAYLPTVEPGDLVKLHVDDGTIKGKVWARVILRLVPDRGGRCVYAARLDQFTVLDIDAKQVFFFEPKHVHYVMGQNEKFY